MQDVASLAGVSLQTVSNFVNGRHDQMSEETLAKVSRALDKLQYRPNVAAASLRSQRARTIAFLVLDEHVAFLADPLTDLLIAGAGDVARDHGYGVLVQGARPDQLDAELLSPLFEGRADGAIIQLSGPRSLRRKTIDMASSAGLSIVIIDETGLSPDVMGVRAQQETGARQLAEFLIEAGHVRIGFIGAAVPWAVVEQRLAGFRTAMRRAGLPVDPGLILLEATYQARDGEVLTRRLLESKKPPTAIMCATDLLAAGAMRAARTMGLDVPRDVAVTGFNDFEFSEYLQPPLTTVRVPAYEMGRTATSMLISAIEDRTPPQLTAVFPTELVLRGST
ncbi:MAG: LacI family DNA-binding transcriptional regulator [Actinobacteria bacterium]|jgi:DNA-binding LacI/PurR family transcriptional regulator|nr:LacI family DNA-binding transcriptional regulator [Actinomycetota bacterium]